MPLPALAAALIAVAATPSTVERLDVATQVARSELILTGRVLASHGFQSPSGRIGTRIALDVSRTFLGAHVERRTLAIVGGRLEDGRALVVLGMPEFPVGERVLLFLSPSAEDGLRTPIGLAQGKYVLSRDERGRSRVARDLSGLTLADASTGRTFAGRMESARSAREVMQELRTAVRARKAREKRSVENAK